MDKIVKLAQIAHRKHWHMSGDASTGTRKAIEVTKDWQQRVEDIQKDIKIEYPVSSNLNERIDVVDFDSKTAYELKVSPSNTHFEFYRDIFKVLACNESDPGRLETLVFITPEISTARIRKGLGSVAIKISEKLGLKVKIEGI